MTDGSFGLLFATDGFYWILTAAFVAGAVRSFSGFGVGMMYLPVPGQFFPIFSVHGLKRHGRFW